MTSREQTAEPILLKAGDTRLLINGYPPKVDCRVVAEEYYQSLLAGYDTAEGKHREFYLLVRDCFRATAYLSTHTKQTEERQLRLDEAAQCSKMILEHLAAFTEREQQNLPKQ